MKNDKSWAEIEYEIEKSIDNSGKRNLIDLIDNLPNSLGLTSPHIKRVQEIDEAMTYYELGLITMNDVRARLGFEPIKEEY